MRRPYIIAIVLLTSCELIVDVEVPFEQKRITVNSIFSADSLWSATISLNRHILDDSPFEKLSNATCILYQNDIAIDTLKHLNDGFYQSSERKPVAGNWYELRVVSKNHEPVKAKSYIPDAAPILGLEVSTGTTVEGMPETTYRVRFKDDPNQINFYQIVMEVEDEYIDFQTGLIVTSRRRVSIESHDPIISSENENSYDGILLKDVFFNGKETEISFKTMSYTNSTATFIMLRTLSADFYNYKKTVDLQGITSGDPFAQPVNAHNNVENGLGIFAGFSTSTYELRSPVPKPVILSISTLTGKPGDRIVLTHIAAFWW